MVKPSSTFTTCTDFAQQLCVEINTVRSLTVWLMIEHACWDELATLSIDPSLYEDVDQFRNDYLVTEVLRKSPDLPASFDRTQEALKAYHIGEEMCATANQLLSTTPPDSLHGISREIQKVIGTLSREDLSILGNLCDHGSGATLCLKGRGLTKSEKYRSSQPTATVSLIPFVRALIGDSWADQIRSVEIVEGNSFFTVPKTAKTDRGCSKEPLLNLYLQKGIGQLIRRKLRVEGYDIRTQESNRLLAARAQQDGLATIDLSMASDTISAVLVYKLLPPRWFELLDLARSKKTYLPDGTLHTTEKFSSMGNGFTFELETLIFLGIARYCVPRSEWSDIGVYGDDIIVPQRYAQNVINTLASLGMQVNRSKTFLAGRFYESCGVDFFDGVNVRPFHIKEAPKGRPVEMVLANKLRLWSRLPCGNCDPTWRPLWLQLYKSVPKRYRKCLVPSSFGDTGFIVSRREISDRADGNLEDNFRITYLVERPKKRDFQDIFTLWATGHSGASNFPVFLGRTIVREATAVRFSYGREPVRGHLRKPRITTQVHYVPGGMEWLC